jgi:hypothetical protein
MIHTLVAMATTVIVFSLRYVLGQKKQLSIKAWLAWLPSSGMLSVRYIIIQNKQLSIRHIIQNTLIPHFLWVHTCSFANSRIKIHLDPLMDRSIKSV